MESSLPSLVLSLYQVTLAEALPAHSQTRRARSRSKAVVESLRAAEGARHPQWGEVKEGRGGHFPTRWGPHCRCFPGRGVHMCVGACTHVSMCTHVHVEARGQVNCHSSGTLVFYCLSQSLSLAWGHRLGWSGWPASPRDPPVCPSPVLTL